MVTIETRLISKTQISDLAEALSKQFKVMAPVRRDGVCFFEWLESGLELDLSCVIPRSSPKQALLPRAEPLFSYKLEKGRQEILPPPAPQQQVLFGLHPCDVKAVAVLDAVFSAEPVPDQLYLARRAKTIIVGRGSLEIAPTAFFLELGVDPMDNAGCDLFLIPLDSSLFALEILTEKGRLFEKFFADCPNADEEALKSVAELRAEAASLAGNSLDHEGAAAALSRLFDSDLWDEFHETCAGCGICTFLCPTCHCFDIQEERRGSEGARVRVWDTCQFDLFTRHAAGHNPRPSQKERVRQRVMHKFSYGYEKFKLPFCVGCGRCVACCPANNDLRELLKKLNLRLSKSEAEE